MTTVRTLRYENGERKLYHQRQWESDAMAWAYADFMATAGYCVEVESC